MSSFLKLICMLLTVAVLSGKVYGGDTPAPVAFPATGTELTAPADKASVGVAKGDYENYVYYYNLGSEYYDYYYSTGSYYYLAYANYYYSYAYYYYYLYYYGDYNIATCYQCYSGFRLLLLLRVLWLL